MKKGFTLIELLVVVLIIGILAAIALPQYTKAVEKSRMAEAVITLKNLQGAVERYILQNGESFTGPISDDELDITLSGGKWEDNFYKTKHYHYYVEGNGMGDEYGYYVGAQPASGTWDADNPAPVLEILKIGRTDGPLKVCIYTSGNKPSKAFCDAAPADFKKGTDY
ncbi:prepilin-type N-terminal cleavage/methylation domain-containing protein [Elusimicrobium posterum]|uniref:type IV pilin protein n=1 Tax=Elusimicrobium posterum TaxID=3116653 RepID=UPI003C733369